MSKANKSKAPTPSSKNKAPLDGYSLSGANASIKNQKDTYFSQKVNNNGYSLRGGNDSQSSIPFSRKGGSKYSAMPANQSEYSLNSSNAYEGYEKYEQYEKSGNSTTQSSQYDSKMRRNDLLGDLGDKNNMQKQYGAPGQADILLQSNPELMGGQNIYFEKRQDRGHQNHMNPDQIPPNNMYKQQGKMMFSNGWGNGQQSTDPKQDIINNLKGKEEDLGPGNFQTFYSKSSSLNSDELIPEDFFNTKDEDIGYRSGAKGSDRRFTTSGRYPQVSQSIEPYAPSTATDTEILGSIFPPHFTNFFLDAMSNQMKQLNALMQNSGENTQQGYGDDQVYGMRPNDRPPQKNSTSMQEVNMRATPESVPRMEHDEATIAAMEKKKKVKAKLDAMKKKYKEKYQVSLNFNKI